MSAQKRECTLLLLLACVGGADADTYTAVATEITAIPLDFQGGPAAQDEWYTNDSRVFALLARTRTPEIASPVLYGDVHNVCSFTVLVQNTTLPVGRPYGIIVKLYSAVDPGDNGPADDPLIVADTGPDFLMSDDQFAYGITFTVSGDCPAWAPNPITFPDGSSATGNWLSVTYQGEASGPDEDNATDVSNGPASPLSTYFFSVDDRMMRPWPLPETGPYGFTLHISE